jgi:hypothetical protein
MEDKNSGSIALEFLTKIVGIKKRICNILLHNYTRLIHKGTSNNFYLVGSLYL